MFFKKFVLVTSLAAASFMPVLAHAQTADTGAGSDLGTMPIQAVSGLGQSPIQAEAGFGQPSAELQSSRLGGMFAMFGAVLLIALIPLLAVYIFAVVAMIYIAKKTNTPHGWLVIIPFVIPFKIAKFAGMSYWWGLLTFLPLLSFGNRVLYALFLLVSFAFGIYLWMRICERLGHSKFLGLLMILPLVNLILLGYLAFSSDSAQQQGAMHM